jgi:glycosyltransferase involved in cell wall biosynthesis
MRQERVDVIHTNTLKAGFYGCLAARWARIPAVWHVRDRLAPDYLPALAILLTRIALTVLPQRIICNSAATKSTLAPRWAGWVTSKALVAASPIPDVLDVVYDPSVARSGSGSGLTVGMVGRFAPWKGQLVVVRAFAAADLPGSRLVLIGSPMFGEDDYLEAVLQEVRDLGLEDRVEVRGFVDDVFGALSEIDVLVHASLSPEPFGQVIIEGLAAGVPVVATRGGGPSEILTDEVNGLFYEAGDVEELTRLLCRLECEPVLREQLRQQGLRRARDFAPDVIGPLVLGVYEELARTQRSRIRR